MLWQPGEPVEILEVDLAPPKEGEVLVQIAACGVCAQRPARGRRRPARAAAARPRPRGRRSRRRDRARASSASRPATTSCSRSCLPAAPAAPAGAGRRNFCELAARMAATGTLADGTSRLVLDGTGLHHFNSVSSFAEYAVVPESAAVPIRRDVPLEVAALCGCAVITGYGAVVEHGRVEPGASVAVWGCGGVGLNVVQGARLAGAATIVAVDTRPEKLELARAARARPTVSARPGRGYGGSRPRPHRRRRRLRLRGDRARADDPGAWGGPRPGGTVVVVGMMPKGDRSRSTPGGSSTRRRSRAASSARRRSTSTSRASSTYYAEGELELDELVSHRLPLDELARGLRPPAGGRRAPSARRLRLSLAPAVWPGAAAAPRAGCDSA